MAHLPPTEKMLVPPHSELLISSDQPDLLGKKAR
jgi:hypothetical protein